MTDRLARETIAALAPAARAFERAKKKGHVWVGKQGTLLTYEHTGMWRPSEPPPHQLTLDDLTD
jgi:hypothetical protein